MSAIIDMLSSVLTAVVGWIGELATMVEAQPIILIGFALAIIGMVVHQLRKLVRGI